MSDKLSTWMPIYWGDYWRDTAHLSCAQHGAYLNLIGECWVRRGLLPLDDDELWRLARADGVKHWSVIKDKVLKLFVRHDDGYRHKRIDAEMVKQARYQRSQAEKGKQGAAKRWNGRGDGPANGREHGREMAAAIHRPMAQPSETMAGAMAQASPGQWPADAKPKPNISPLPPSPDPGEFVARPPAVRVNASGGLSLGLKRIPSDRPMSPSEVARRKAEIAAECEAAGLTAEAKP